MVAEIIVAVLIFILFVPMRLNYSIYLNLLENRGADYFQIWNLFVVIQEKFEIANGEVTIENKKNKTRHVELSQADKEVVFTEILVPTILRKVILHEVLLFFEVGKKDDALTTAVISGGAITLCESALAILRTKKSGFVSLVDCDSLFTENKLALTINVKAYSNVFDVVFSFIKSKIKANYRIKEKLNEKRQRFQERNSGNSGTGNEQPQEHN